MAKRKRGLKRRFSEWQPGSSVMIRLVDQGRPVRINPEVFGIRGRDRSWNQYAQSFLSANHATFSTIDVQAILDAQSDRIELKLKPGGTVGAVPLCSPTTRKILGGVIVSPRFGWGGIGRLLQNIGWTASPQVLELPLVPGAAKDVPPWVIAGPMLERFQILMMELSRGFRWHEDIRQSPRGQILWSKYFRQIGRGDLHRIPCRFPELGPDLQLRGMLRWAIQAILRSLAGCGFEDPIASKLSTTASELLVELADVEPVVPSRAKLRQLLIVAGMPTRPLKRGLQALGWILDERGLAGTSESDGLAWSLSMHELFERWVESLTREWSSGFGGVVRTGRTHETLVPLRWSSGAAHSLGSLIPDIVVERGDHVWLIDAKYKGHFEELDDRRWASIADEMRSEHRHDVHQALAYAATTGATNVTTILVYPMHLRTWERLNERNQSIAIAAVPAGERQLRMCLVGVPLYVPHSSTVRELVQSWNRLRFDQPA